MPRKCFYIQKYTFTFVKKMNSYNINFRTLERCFEITQNTWNRNDTTYGKDFSVSGKQGRIAFTAYGTTGDIVFNNYDASLPWQTRMIIKADGKVGIGTDHPTSNLDIVSHDSPILKIRTGTIGQGNSAEINLIGSNEGNFAKINFSNIENDGNADINAYIRVVNYGAEDVAKIEFGTSDEGAPHTKMTILGNGNVGIGVTSPVYALGIKDTARACKVIAENPNGWCDYVFEDSYNLMPIDALKEYIQTEKHLPGIPTESEVMENGIDLGDMNAELLQKIEELTLYVIKLQKQIDEQQRIIETLNK